MKQKIDAGHSKPVTRDQARRVAANLAKLPSLLVRQSRQRSTVLIALFLFRIALRSEIGSAGRTNDLTPKTRMCREIASGLFYFFSGDLTQPSRVCHDRR